MPRGLTYTTKNEAETMARDYHLQGKVAKVKQTGPLEWKVFIETGLNEPSVEDIMSTEGILTDEESEQDQIDKWVKQKRIAEKVEKLTKPSEKEEVREALKTAKRRLAVKSALEKTPEQVQEAYLAKKKKNLEDTMLDRTKRGRTPGILVPIYDPETNRIVDYRLDTGTGAAELEKKFRGYIKKAGDVPLEVLKSSESVMQNATSGQSIKFSRNAPGKQLGSPGGISNMQRPGIGSFGAVGSVKPAIGAMRYVNNTGSISDMTSPSLNNAQLPTKGTLKTETYGNNKSIKATPNVDKLMMVKKDNVDDLRRLHDSDVLE
jgi:hypothetical protein